MHGGVVGGVHGGVVGGVHGGVVGGVDWRVVGWRSWIERVLRKRTQRLRMVVCWCVELSCGEVVRIREVMVWWLVL